MASANMGDYVAGSLLANPLTGPDLTHLTRGPYPSTSRAPRSNAESLGASPLCDSVRADVEGSQWLSGAPGASWAS